MGLCPSVEWVRDKVWECQFCQQLHRPQPSEEMGSWHELSMPGEVVGFDFMGPFFSQGGRKEC